MDLHIATLTKIVQSDVIPVWLSKSLIPVLISVFNEICVRQGAKGEISAFLALDGTGLSCRIGYKALPETDHLMLTGVESQLHTPFFINKVEDRNIGYTYRSIYQGNTTKL